MKKIILMFIAVLGIIFIIPDSFAFELPNEYPLGGVQTNYDSIMIGEVYYHAHGVMRLGDAVLTPSLSAYRDDIAINPTGFKSAYFVSFTRDVNIRLRDTLKDDLITDIRSAVFVFDFFKSFSTYRIYAYYYDSIGDLIFSEWYSGTNVIFEPITYVIGTTTYEQGFAEGYNQGSNEGYNRGSDEGYNIGYDYGYDIGYGDGHYEGYNQGLSNEIDWFSWSMTFFLMPFRILNIQILPGVRIGYFALFSLLLGVVGWFFFIVGKGGGKRK